MNQHEKASDIADAIQDLIDEAKGEGLTVGVYSNTLYIWSVTDGTLEERVEL